MKMLLTRGQRLGLFACISVIGFVIASCLMGFFVYRWGMAPKALRIGTIIQDLLMFIAPPLVVACLVTRQPAQLLCLTRPPLVPTLMCIATLVVSLPAMNLIIAANQAVTLPPALSGLEQWLRVNEEQTGAMVNAMIEMPNVMALIVSILIVGVMAGLSEELFFRAGLQRLLTTGGMRRALAIWLTAVVFSALHMQFFGFVPRLLLGAFFGYALVWTGSVWTPIIAHAFNNTLYIIMVYLYGPDAADQPLSTIGTDPGDALLVALSAVLTVAGIVLLYKSRVSTISKEDITTC